MLHRQEKKSSHQGEERPFHISFPPCSVKHLSEKNKDLCFAFWFALSYLYMHRSDLPAMLGTRQFTLQC